MSRSLVHRFAPTALLLVLCAAATPADAQIPFFGSSVGVTNPSRHVAVYNFVGDVEVRAADARQVEVAADLHGPHRGRLSLYNSRGRVVVEYPGDRILASAFTRTRRVGLGRHGEFLPADGAERVVTLASDGDGTRASADLEIDLPEGRSVTVHLYAGRVRLAGTTQSAETRGEPLRVRVENVDGRLRMERLDG